MGRALQRRGRSVDEHSAIYVGQDVAKARHARVRRVLVESAWKSRHVPRISTMKHYVHERLAGRARHRCESPGSPLCPISSAVWSRERADSGAYRNSTRASYFPAQNPSLEVTRD